MSTLRRGIEILREDGPKTLLQKLPPYLYQQLWPSLPRDKPVVLNGVASSQHKRLTDRYVPASIKRYVPTDDPAYEEQYVDCIRRHCEQGESVVVVGGGEGVSAIATANRVGPDGDVTVFEGGADEATKTETAARLNDVGDRVTVNHAIVSEDYSLRSDAGDARMVAPDSLPTCDTLAIDADGAELSILKDLTEAPYRLIVEHHAVEENGDIIVEYRPESVREALRKCGHQVVEECADQAGAYGRYEERIFVSKRGQE